MGAAVDTFDINGFGELKEVTTAVDSEDRYALTLDRDALGRIWRKTEVLTLDNSPPTVVTTRWIYTYDTAGRLDSAGLDANNDAVADDPELYDYDLNGNRYPSGETEADVDGQDRLRTWGAVSFTYTDHGTLASRTVSSATTTYTYDVFGQLREVDLPSPGPTITYGVDALGRRISRDDGTTVNRYVYSGDRLIAEVDDEGVPERRYVYASRGHVPDLMVTGSGVYRLITDHLGSVRLVVHVDTGVIAQRIDYDPWGAVTEDTSPGLQVFGFAGGLYDPDTGLVRFGARDYDAQMGRWTAKDPIRFAGGDTNLYAYVGNEPINWIDPSGLIIESGWDALNIGMGVASFTANAASGNVPGALLDGAGLVVDGAALLTPGVPAEVRDQRLRPCVVRRWPPPRAMRWRLLAERRRQPTAIT